MLHKSGSRTKYLRTVRRYYITCMYRCTIQFLCVPLVPLNKKEFHYCKIFFYFVLFFFVIVINFLPSSQLLLSSLFLTNVAADHRCYVDCYPSCLSFLHDDCCSLGRLFPFFLTTPVHYLRQIETMDQQYRYQQQIEEQALEVCSAHVCTTQ